MPILLTTPWNPGNFDPGKTYPYAKILTFTQSTENKWMRVAVDFGYMNEGVWSTGSAKDKEKMYTIRGEDYDTMIAAMPEEGEKVYDAVKRLLYAYLVAHVPELAGTIE